MVKLILRNFCKIEKELEKRKEMERQRLEEEKAIEREIQRQKKQEEMREKVYEFKKQKEDINDYIHMEQLLYKQAEQKFKSEQAKFEITNFQNRVS
jgi:arylamine N-acetyltransferase